MKHIRNWKIAKDGLLFSEAYGIMSTGRIDGVSYPNMAIQQAHGKQYSKSEVNNITLKPSDVLYHDWMILIPDTDEEIKCEKIRQLVKDSNCSGLNHNKIDNLTIPEIFEWITDHLDNDQKYKVLLAFYDQKLYKTK